MKVVKIGAEWCTDCVIMRPRWQEIERENLWLDTEYIDYDKKTEPAKKYMGDIRDIPVFVFLDESGNELEKLSGTVSKKILLQKINKYRNL